MSTDNLILSAQFLTPTRFAASIKKFPGVEFNVNKFTLPSISLGKVDQPNMMSAQVAWPGEKLVLEPLTFTFLVDEELANYFEIADWMFTLGTPFDYISYNQQTNSTLDSMSTDITLITRSNSKNATNAIHFIGCIPMFLSQVDFSTGDVSTDPIEAQATFFYERYYRERILTSPDTK